MMASTFSNSGLLAGGPSNNMKSFYDLKLNDKLQAYEHVQVARKL